MCIGQIKDLDSCGFRADIRGSVTPGIPGSFLHNRHYAKLTVNRNGLADKALRWFLFIADILGSPTQRFCPSTRTILLGRKPMQTISDDLATNAEKSGQLDAVERFFSRLTHCNSSSCGIVRPASTSAKPSRVRRSFSAADSSGSKANSSSSRVIYVEKQVLRSDCTWRRWDGSWDQPGVRAMVGGHRGPPSRPRRPVLRLGTE